MSAANSIDPLNRQLLEKSIAAAISAIEIYNKPDFRYREETFAILMVNAWELILKAKAVLDAGDKIEAIFVIDKATGQPKTTRSKNPMTHEVTYLSESLLTRSVPGMTRACAANINLLIEVRDNAIHFFNCDLHFSRRVMEIGTASLKNYLDLVGRWFRYDLRRFNFYLMPISFYHEFESAECISVSSRSQQVNNFLRYVEAQEAQQATSDLAQHQVTVAVQTNFVRTKADDALAIRVTADPNAPALQIREEDILKSFPIRYRELEAALRRRYINFKADQLFRKVMRELQGRGRPYCHPRYLDPDQKKGPPKWFYSSAMFEELDKHYERSAVTALAAA